MGLGTLRRHYKPGEAERSPSPSGPVSVLDAPEYVALAAEKATLLKFNEELSAELVKARAEIEQLRTSPVSDVVTPPVVVDTKAKRRL